MGMAAPRCSSAHRSATAPRPSMRNESGAVLGRWIQGLMQPNVAIAIGGQTHLDLKRAVSVNTCKALSVVAFDARRCSLSRAT